MTEATAIPDFISRQVGEARYFFLDLNPPAEADLAVVCGGCEHCLPHYRVQRAAFRYHSIEYVLRGRGWLQLNQGTYPIQAGTVFCYAPGVKHDIRADPDQPPVKCFVDFVGNQASKLLTEAGLRLDRVSQLPVAHLITDLLESLIQAGTAHTPRRDAVCCKLLELLCVRIAEQIEDPQHAPQGAYQTYVHCRRVLDQRFRQLATLDELADHCSVDPAYLCRLFKQFARQSPYKTLVTMKMNHAATSLIRSGRLIKQVAMDVGYDDPYHFSRVFKRIHGVGPDTFRKQAQPSALTDDA